MEYKLQRSGNEIDELINVTTDGENDGTLKFPGMSYESGIKTALEWVIGEREEHPMAD